MEEIPVITGMEIPVLKSERITLASRALELGVIDVYFEIRNIEEQVVELMENSKNVLVFYENKLDEYYQFYKRGFLNFLEKIRYIISLIIDFQEGRGLTQIINTNE